MSDTTTPTDTLTGLEHIAAAFAAARARGTAALMPYYTLGYPDRATSLDIVAAIAADSDLLELGVPFSDPLADGPTIQHSTQAVSYTHLDAPMIAPMLVPATQSMGTPASSSTEITPM